MFIFLPHVKANLVASSLSISLFKGKVKDGVATVICWQISNEIVILGLLNRLLNDDSTVILAQFVNYISVLFLQLKVLKYTQAIIGNSNSRRLKTDDFSYKGCCCKCYDRRLAILYGKFNYF